MSSPEGNRKGDLFAVTIIGLYSLIHFMLRLLVSPSMAVDESQQFLQGISLNTRPQPQLYSLIIETGFLLFGRNFTTILSFKFLILFAFYLSFYRLARSYWDDKESLIVTASLVFLPAYSYEFIRDLSHSILSAVFAVVAATLYIKTFSSKDLKFVLALVITLCLGMLSKYVFFFFLAALILSDVFIKRRWKTIDKRMMLLVIVFPALSAIILFILINHGAFPVLQRILDIAGQGTLDLSSPLRILKLLLSNFLQILIFAAVFLLFFHRHISTQTGSGFLVPVFFRFLSAFSILLPFAVILILKLGMFKTRWITPVMFTVPLAFFSLVDLESVRKPLKLFGYCCVTIAVSIIIVRTLVGFFPDVVGKTERIHIPFRAISAELKQKTGISESLVIISNSEPVIANMMLWLPMRHYAIVNGKGFLESGDPAAIREKGGIIIWNASVDGEAMPGYFLKVFPSARPLAPLSAPYLHSNKIFSMGVAVIPKAAP